jgi:hypothetical protein
MAGGLDQGVMMLPAGMVSRITVKKIAGQQTWTGERFLIPFCLCAAGAACLAAADCPSPRAPRPGLGAGVELPAAVRLPPASYRTQHTAASLRLPAIKDGPRLQLGEFKQLS